MLDDEKPFVDEWSTCLTSDLSDRGARLVLSQPLHAEQVLLGYWIDDADMTEPWFFLADVRRCRAAGGGFWNLGVELMEFANDSLREEIAPLRKFAERLLPPAVK